MGMVATLAGLGGTVFVCGALFVVLLVGLVIWYAVKQPAQIVSATPPEPVIQASIEHPTAAAPAPAPAAPEPPASEPPSTNG